MKILNLSILLMKNQTRHQTVYLQTADPAPFTSQTVLMPQGEGEQGDWGATPVARTATMLRMWSILRSTTSYQTGL